MDHFFLTFSLFKKCDKINGLKYLTHVEVAIWLRELQPSALWQPRGWGVRRGGRFKRGRGHMYTCGWFLLMYGKAAQYCKANILQLKKRKKKYWTLTQNLVLKDKMMVKIIEMPFRKHLCLKLFFSMHMILWYHTLYDLKENFMLLKALFYLSKNKYLLYQNR